LAGSEKSSSFVIDQEGLKGWQLSERQEKIKERIKEGQYINKSLFFLTQVIKKKTIDSHVPYRNTSLTKILKSSLGGNTKTCVILCISPTINQLEHSLQTLKFGRTVSKIENRVERNIIKTTSEDTLKFLIQEYQARLESLDKGTSNNELKAENDMLWQQFVLEDQYKSMVTVPKDISKGRTLIQFYMDDDIYCTNEPDTKSNIIKTFIEALKLSCKNTFYWKSRALNLEKKVKELSKEIVGRNTYIGKLLDITEDCFRALKAQVAKVEIYEQTEKWAQQFNVKALNSLATHFKAKLQQIQQLIDYPKFVKEQPKLDLKLKNNEQYIVSLLKDGKAVIESGINGNIEIPNKYTGEAEADKKLISLIQSLKKELCEPGKKLILTEFKPELELSSTPKQTPQRSRASPKPRTPNAHQAKFEDKGICNLKQKTTKIESRSKSSKRGNKEIAKLGAIIDKAVRVASTQKSTPRGTNANNLGTEPHKSTTKLASEVYEMGAFSKIQSPQQLKKALIKDELAEEKNKGEILQTWHRLIGLK